MTEQIIKKYQCERCNLTKELDIKPGFFGFIKNPSPPAGWSNRNKIQLCSACVTNHDHEYKQWFTKWLSEGKNE